MGALLVSLYPWVKSLHIASVIAWMAGLLYLPRLFVYHAMTQIGSETSETFKVMERRLLRGIMTPAMIATWSFGLLLAATPGVVDWRQGWMWTKLFLVLCLSLFHLALWRWQKAFAADRNRHGARFFRSVNELPALAMLLIVFLVVAKPF